MTITLKAALIMGGSLLALNAAPALADCAPTGSTITCTATDTDGVTSATDGIKLIIKSGATVTNDDHTVVLDGDDATVRNLGTINSEKDAIKGEDGFTLVNRGTINADDDGVDVGDDATITNNGTIAVADKAIDLGDDGTLVNRGVIEAGGEGAETDDNATIINFGRISAIDDALNPGQNVTIKNYGIIENVATESDEPQDAIDLDSGTIYNARGARISSTFDAAIDYDEGNGMTDLITNHGTISGVLGVLVDPSNVSAQHITNYGTITGTGGTALDLGGGDDVVSLKRGSTLNGGIDLGGDNDLLSMSGKAAQYGTLGLLDGGDGEDELKMFDVALSNIAGITGTADYFSLTLAWDHQSVTETFLYEVANFEWITLGDTTYTTADLVSRYPAAVPLPAAGLMLLGGLGGLAGLSRRRRRKGATA